MTKGTGVSGRRDEPMMHLVVDDARTAQQAGTEFARALAGAGGTDFMLALSEQGDVVRRAIVDAGFSTEQAQLAAEHFEAAARAEWTRIASAATTDAWGTA